MLKARQFLWLFATTVFFTLLAGCSGSSSSSGGTTTAPLTSISVAPSAQSISQNATQQFTATGNYSDSTTQDLTSVATWSSNSIAVSINSSGVATGVTGGSSATITATSSGINGTASLTVSAAPGANATLSSITVAPNVASIAKGATQQLTATGHYSDSTTLDLTTSATWTSSNTAVSTISSNGGLATGVAWSGGGDVTMTATSSGAISGTAKMTVTAKLESITVTSALSSIVQYTTQQFTATGHYSDNTTRDLTATTTWSSGNSAVTINSSGLATGATAGGPVTITATSNGVSGTKDLSVTPIIAPQGTLANPSLITMPYNQGQILMSASGTPTSYYKFITTASISKITLTNSLAAPAPAPQVSVIIGGATPTTWYAGWSCSPATGVPPVTCTGTAIAASNQVFITVTNASGNPTSFTLDIPPTSITVASSTASIPNNTTQQFTATGIYNSGPSRVLTSLSTWSSDNTTIATVNNSGVASSVAVGGPVTMTATYAGVSGMANLTVNSATLSSIAVTSSTAAIPNGSTQQFTATGTYSDASTKDLSAAVTWTTSDAATATISSTGLATGVAVGGPVTMTAAMGGVSGTATLQVN